MKTEHIVIIVIIILVLALIYRDTYKDSEHLDNSSNYVDISSNYVDISSNYQELFQKGKDWVNEYNNYLSYNLENQIYNKTTEIYNNIFKLYKTWILREYYKKKIDNISTQITALEAKSKSNSKSFMVRLNLNILNILNKFKPIYTKYYNFYKNEYDNSLNIINKYPNVRSQINIDITSKIADIENKHQYNNFKINFLQNKTVPQYVINFNNKINSIVAKIYQFSNNDINNFLECKFYGIQLYKDTSIQSFVSSPITETEFKVLEILIGGSTNLTTTDLNETNYNKINRKLYTINKNKNEIKFKDNVLPFTNNNDKTNLLNNFETYFSKERKLETDMMTKRENSIGSIYKCDSVFYEKISSIRELIKTDLVYIDNMLNNEKTKKYLQ